MITFYTKFLFYISGPTPGTLTHSDNISIHISTEIKEGRNPVYKYQGRILVPLQDLSLTDFFDSELITPNLLRPTENFTPIENEYLDQNQCKNETVLKCDNILH